MHLNLPDSAQKKFWRPNFLKILTFYLVKSKPLALTRRVKKSTLLHTQCYIWHQNMKQNFISDLLIPFFFRPGASKGFWSHFSIFFPRFLHFLPFLSPQKPPSVFPYTRCTKNFLPPPLDTLGVLRDTPLGSLGNRAHCNFLVDAEEVAFHVNIGSFMASWCLLWRAPVAYRPP